MPRPRKRSDPVTFAAPLGRRVRVVTAIGGLYR